MIYRARSRWLLTFLVLIFIPTGADLFACVCLEPPPPRQALRKASAVFIGQVQTVEPDGAGTVQFRPLVVWKGIDIADSSFTVFSARFEGCIFQFQEGETYLVYAYDGPTYFSIDYSHATNSCTRTKLGTPASEEIKQLPAPRWYRSADKGGRNPDCIEMRLDELVEEARRREAALRVEVKILDDDCNQTVQMILWRASDEAVRAEGLLGDHLAVRRSVFQIRRENPDWSDSAVCAAVPMREVKAQGSEQPALLELTEGIKAMLAKPVLEPLLIIHGLQYDIRIESGISESTFIFHAPGYPRPLPEALHPLDRWSQELRESLGLDCDQDLGGEQRLTVPRTGC